MIVLNKLPSGFWLEVDHLHVNSLRVESLSIYSKVSVWHVVGIQQSICLIID